MKIRKCKGLVEPGRQGSWKRIYLKTFLFLFIGDRTPFNPPPPPPPALFRCPYLVELYIVLTSDSCILLTQFHFTYSPHVLSLSHSRLTR